MRRLLATNTSRPSWLLAAASLLAPVAAQAETEPIRIEYRAVQGCPSIEEFRSQVFARTASARPATEGEMARTFVVSIEAARNGVIGSLVVREASGATLARKVEGARCEQVATVLSLATALAIDPQAPEPARTRESVNADGSNNPSSDSAKTAPSAARAKGEADPRPAKDESIGAEQPDRANTPEPTGPESSGAWWTAAVGPSLETGTSPRLSLGASAQLERHRHAPGALVSAFGLELSWLEGPSYAVNTASSSFRFFHARPFVCPSELALLEALRAGPCLGVELGAVTGTGADLPNASSETRFWAAAEARARLRFEPGQRWFVELAAALVVPLTRYTFVFREPETQIYEVPWLGTAAGLRLGLRL